MSMILINKKYKKLPFSMFLITNCDLATGHVTVEDIDFGLRYEFVEPELASAEIIDDYDLHITTTDGQTRILPILIR